MKNIFYCSLLLFTTSYYAMEVQLVSTYYTLKGHETWPRISCDTASKMGTFNDMVATCSLDKDKQEIIDVNIPGTLTTIKTFANLLSQDNPQIPQDISPEKVCEITNIADQTQADELQKLLLEHMYQQKGTFQPYLSQLNPGVQKIFNLKTLTQENFTNHIIPYKCDKLDIASHRTVCYYNPSTQTTLSYYSVGPDLKINDTNIEISKNEWITDILSVTSNKQETLFLCEAIVAQGQNSFNFPTLLLHKTSSGFQKYTLNEIFCLIPNQPHSLFSLQDKKVIYYDHIPADFCGSLAQGQILCDTGCYFENHELPCISTNDEGNIVAVVSEKKIIIITLDEQSVPIVKEIRNQKIQKNQPILSAALSHKGDKLAYVAISISPNNPEELPTQVKCIMTDVNNAENKFLCIPLPNAFLACEKSHIVLDMQFSPQDDWLVFHHDIMVYYYHINTQAHFILPRGQYTCLSTDCSTVIQTITGLFPGNHKIPILETINQLCDGKEVEYIKLYKKKQPNISKALNALANLANIIKYTCGAVAIGLMFILIKRYYNAITFH